MEIESLFFAALQSSFLLGLIHGINPCGHSWLVLAPFVVKEKKGSYVALLTMSFVGGTALACIVLGASLGTISSYLPASAGFWVDLTTSIILLVLGALLIYNPDLLHSHDHDEHHDHDCAAKSTAKHKHERKRWLAPSLFGVGFVNMIIPCPTAAVMYGYAINSGSAQTAMIVFASYAAATAIAVGGVIYLIFRMTAMAARLQRDWIENVIMRSAGLIIVVFSIYGIYSSTAT